MATITLSEAPELVDADYHDYRAWLDGNFFYQICAYCLLHSPDLEIDHYEPQKYATDRIHDPSNLLLGCGTCNGPACKKDYHPQHARRTTRKHDTTGFLILDIRADDLAELYSVSIEGRISPKKGLARERAKWNIEILKLDMKAREDRRRENLEMLDSADVLMGLVAEQESEVVRQELELVLTRLVGLLAKDRLFFDVFGIPMSAELRARVDSEHARLLEA